MTFKKAIESTPSVAASYKVGLQALRKQDKPHVQPQSPNRLTGSADIDAALTAAYPQANRWDYGIGHQPTNEANEANEVIYWVEIHSANSKEVNVVLAKLEFHRAWLKNSAPALEKIRRKFVWVSSGKTHFSLSAPQKKKFAQLGLIQVGQILKISDKF